jgi:hypothetical protein
MPISAYDSEGRLKKHALKGTSFAVDPSRSAQRQQFGELYNEAKANPAGGREAMLGKLKSRFTKYGNQQNNRLSDLAKQKELLSGQGPGLRDTDYEADLDRYTQWQEQYGDQPWVEKNFKTTHIPQDVLDETNERFEGMGWREKRDWAEGQEWNKRVWSLSLELRWLLMFH